MPFLSFEAVDAHGKVVRGTLQATNMQELEKMLIQRGMRLLQNGSAPSAAAPQRPMQVARPVQPVQPVRQNPVQQTPRPVRQEVAASQRFAAPTPATTITPVPTPELSTKELFFIFSQFATFFRSGFSVNQAIQPATSRATAPKRQMSHELEQETAGGTTLSDSMEKRPNAFPPDMVAVIRAGEQSGAMPEACDNIVNQLERGKSFRLMLGYFFLMSPLLILCGVGGIGIQKACGATLRRQFDADGQLPRFGTLAQEMAKQTPLLLLGVLCSIAFIIFIKFWHKNAFRKTRHKLGISVPMGHSRGQSEAIERFSWSMSTMLKGGASPASAANIAASSIPNLVLRQRALDALGGTRENETLGSLMMRSGLMTPEYVHIAQNGELTGDVPGALNSIVQAESSEVQAKSTKLNVIGAVLTTLAMGIFVAIMVAVLYQMYASGIIKMMMEQ